MIEKRACILGQPNPNAYCVTKMKTIERFLFSQVGIYFFVQYEIQLTIQTT
jgi:hypothetical protein